MARPKLLLLLALAVALALAGCAGKDEDDQPALGGEDTEQRAADDLGFPGVASKNTTRVAGEDATATAAAVARAVFPDAARRPDAVTLADAGDWRSALAASVLTADPIGAPILFTEGTDLPKASREALEVLDPTGSEAAGNAEVIRIGDVARPEGRETTDVRGANPFALSRRILGLVTAARKRPPNRVLLVSADNPAMAAPAAGYAAKSGVPILFARRNSIPKETRDALGALDRPQILVLGPSKLISPKVTARLRELGTVLRTGGDEPVTNAIEFTRYRAGDFGWGITGPGHGFVFLRAGRPLDAAAAAPLSANGSYGPQLMLDAPNRLTREMQQYLLDVQPGYRTDPAAGVPNHGWIIGDQEAISAPVQARIDVLFELVPENIPEEGAPEDEPEAEPEDRRR